jgi:hypothetical protein
MSKSLGVETPGKRVAWWTKESDAQPGEYAQFDPNATTGMSQAEVNAKDPRTKAFLYDKEFRSSYQPPPHNLAGKWFGCTPSGLLVNLSNHEVTLNGDGTITVDGEIKVGTEKDGTHTAWHGVLRRGIWFGEVIEHDQIIPKEE